jgi:hypothetical protein
LLYPPGHGRLGQVQMICRGGKRTAFGYGEKGFQIFESQSVSSLRWRAFICLGVLKAS